MVCSRGSWDPAFYMVECTHPIIGLSGESPATAGTPKAQAPPGNAQAHERQIAGALESGGRLGGHPPKGSGAVGARSLRSPDRGAARAIVLPGRSSLDPERL